MLAEAGIEPDYVTVADLDGPTLAVAARVGSTRLIDNVLLKETAMSTRPRIPARRLPRREARAPRAREMKRRGDRISMVTAYDAPAARLADEAGIELVLVGDSAAMVMLGHESTVPVTLDEMIFLTRAVTRAARRPLVIGDLPFGTYEISDEQAVASAIRHASRKAAPTASSSKARAAWSLACRAIAESNIGVMAHIGLTPQSATKLGGFRAQGRTAEAALALYDDALALEDAGCFALVLEAVPAPVAARITAALEIPTIGIGAGLGTDGQVLVWHDLLGMYAGPTPGSSSATRSSPTRSGARWRPTSPTSATGSFPEEQHTYSIPDEELLRFEQALAAGLQARAASAPRRSAARPRRALPHVQPCTARTPIRSSVAAQSSKATRARRRPAPRARCRSRRVKTAFGRARA